MKNNDTLLNLTTGVFHTLGMWFFVVAVSVMVVVSPSDFTFGLVSSFGLCAVATLCFHLADRWR